MSNPGMIVAILFIAASGVLAVVAIGVTNLDDRAEAQRAAIYLATLGCFAAILST